MLTLRRAIYGIVAADPPMTVRQVFYRLVSSGLIAKTEREYKNVVVRLLGQMRRDGQLPYGWIADSTRWMRKADTYDSLQTALNNLAVTYRRGLWSDSGMYVEVWLEKEALAGVLFQETEFWDVPLMVTRGYPSISFLHSAAETILRLDRPTVLYYVGDHDPSGLDIERSISDGIRELAPYCDIDVERVAVTPAQIREFGLPTRPTKKTDSRSKGFVGESVEVDAIPPRVLRELVRSAIEDHLDVDDMERIEEAEEREREMLRDLADDYAQRLADEEGEVRS